MLPVSYALTQVQTVLSFAQKIMPGGAALQYRITLLAH
jgi:hypothetical protein